MKIAFIGQKGIPHIAGGVETHVEHLAVELVKMGHEAVVYTRPHYIGSKYTSYKGVELVSVPHIYTKYLDAVSHTFLVCLAAWRRKDVDVIHFQSIGPSLFIPLMKILRPRTPIVATFHSQCYHQSKWGFFARKVLQAGEWMVCHLADEVIAVSKVLQEYAHMRYRRDVRYIPNGVHVCEEAPAQMITERYGLHKESYVFAMSRMLRTKRFHDLISAYREIQTDKKLVIAYADTHDDGYLHEVQSLAAGDDRIILIPRKHQNQQLRKELLTNAAVFVLPSDTEGLAITLLEAMACGRCVLASDIIENRNVVQGAGATFRMGDVKDLRTELAALLNDPMQRTQYGHAAQQRVAQEFAWSQIAQDTADVYDAVCAGQRVAKRAAKAHKHAA